MKLLLSFGIGSVPDECAAIVAKILAPLGGAVSIRRAINLAEQWFNVPQVPTALAIEASRLKLREILTAALGPPRWSTPLFRRLGWHAKQLPWFTIDIEHTLAQQWRFAPDAAKAAWKAREPPIGSLLLDDETDALAYEAGTRSLVDTALTTCKAWGFASTYAAHRAVDSWPWVGLDETTLGHCAAALSKADFAYRPLNEPAAYMAPNTWDERVKRPKHCFLQQNLRSQAGVVQSPEEVAAAVVMARTTNSGLSLWADPDWFTHPERIRTEVDTYARRLHAALKGS